MINKRIFFYVISIFLVIFAGIALNIFGLNLGVDLEGGHIIEIRTNLKNIEKILSGKNIKVENILYTNNSVILKSEKIDKENLLNLLKSFDKNVEIISEEEVSPSLSRELVEKSYLAIILVLLGIGIYISIVFKGGRGLIPGYLFGLVVILTLAHDVLSSFGVFLLFSRFLDYYLDTTIIIALLVIAGFSVHDTIVVFDRIRDNLRKEGKLSKELFEKSIRQTLRRSINTSLTTILSILPFIFFIPKLQPFLLTLIVGIIIGTYSSICVATPLVYDFTRK